MNNFEFEKNQILNFLSKLNKKPIRRYIDLYLFDFSHLNLKR